MSCCCSGYIDLGCSNYCDTISLGTIVPTTGTYEIDICQPTVARYFVELVAGQTFLIGNQFNEDATSIFSIKLPNGTAYSIDGDDCWKIENQPSMTQGTITPTCCTPGFVGTITGDGIETDFVITHSLTSRSVQVEVFEDFSPWNKITVDTELTSTAAVTIKFSAFAPPALNAVYKVNVIKVA